MTCPRPSASAGVCPKADMRQAAQLLTPPLRGAMWFRSARPASVERGDQLSAHWHHLRCCQGSRVFVCRVAHSRGRGGGAAAGPQARAHAALPAGRLRGCGLCWPPCGGGFLVRCLGRTKLRGIAASCAEGRFLLWFVERRGKGMCRRACGDFRLLRVLHLGQSRSFAMGAWEALGSRRAWNRPLLAVLDGGAC